MAVTARFVADFSGFVAAIDKAELALVDMSKGAGKVESSLNRMIDNFSGRKLIQEASLMTIAIEKAGGIATLTAKELEQVGAKANDAADKLRKLGYDVPAGLQTLADKTKVANTTLLDMKGIVSGLAGAFGIAFGLQAIVGFGKELLADADALEKLHDKTGISVEGLQRFQAAGDEAGNSIDEITTAITKMEDKLVSGDSSAAGALQKLGLSFEDLKNLTPENQFIAISDALRQVQDPAQQVNIAIDLFGKTGASVLPTLKRGFDDLKGAAVGMSEETVAALDNAGDAMARWWRQGKGIAAEAAVALAHVVEAGFDPATLAAENMDREASALNAKLQTLARTAADAAPKIASIAPPGLPKDLADIEHELTQGVTEAIKTAAAEAKKAADAVVAFQASVRGLSFKVFIEDTSKLNAQIPDLSSHMAEMADRFADVREHMDDLESSGIQLNVVETQTGAIIGGTIIPLFSKLPAVAAQAADQIAKAGEQVQSSFGDRAYSALNDVDKILSNIPGRFADIASIAARTGKAIIDNLASGNVWGAVLAGISGVAAAFGKLFGNNEEKKINPIREAFVQAAGGLAELNARAVEAGVTLTALLNAKNPEAYKKAIDDLNAAFQFQDDAMKTLDDTAAKYGLTLSQMGPQYRQGKLDEQFLQLYQDQKVLAAGGVDFDLILQKQAGSFQDLIDAALETGATIPESLKPAIQRMIDLGLLTDDSGDKLTDLSKLTFAETLDKKFTTLIDTITKLADAITRGLGGALAAIPDTKNIHVTYTVDAPPSAGADFAATGGMVTSSGIQPVYAARGAVIPFVARGTDTVPAMLTPGERVLSVSETRAFNAGQAQGSGNDARIDALLNEIADLRRGLPRAIRDAIILAA